MGLILLTKEKTMTRKDLVSKVAKNTPITPANMDMIVRTILETIKHELIEGGKVTLRGFGTFKTRHKNQRMGRNPKTGETAIITERRVPIFKAGKMLKKLLEK